MDKIQLEEKGYIFKTRRIRGRLGNLLICLENLLLLAKNTESAFNIHSVKHDYNVFKMPRKMDFRSEENNNCKKIIEDDTLFLIRKPYDDSLFIDKNKECLNYVHDSINKKEPLDKVYDNTLVINIRGGRDLFRRIKVNPKYVQPPFAYYKHIIENSGLTDILLVTDGLGYNPVIHELINWNPNIRVAKIETTSQVNIILRAKNFVSTRSTFSLYLSRISKNLERIYIWWEDDDTWNEFNPNYNNCLSKNLKIIKYYSDNYIRSGEWTASKDQLKKMVNHPIEDLKHEIA